MPPLTLDQGDLELLAQSCQRCRDRRLGDHQGGRSTPHRTLARDLKKVSELGEGHRCLMAPEQEGRPPRVVCFISRSARRPGTDELEHDEELGQGERLRTPLHVAVVEDADGLAIQLLPVVGMHPLPDELLRRGGYLWGHVAVHLKHVNGFASVPC